MAKLHFPRVDLRKYFKLKQKVYLINVSENRDKELYESFSGIILGRSKESITLQTHYPTEYTSPEKTSPKQTFKLTTEAMGNGVQVIADLVKVEMGQTFHFKVRSNFEMYQRRQVPRIDTVIDLYHIKHIGSLDDYRREFQKSRQHIMDQVPLGITLQKAKVNLGIGGILVECEAKVEVSVLSLFFLGLNGNEAPVCALGDLVWDAVENDVRRCGYRFIQISKSDQERIGSYIHELWKKNQIATPKPRHHWELLDRMYDEACA